MASKLALTAALLVALVALATATTYTTTVTTTTFDDEVNPEQRQQCQQQIQGRRFQSCQRYLSQRGQYNDGEEGESVLEMSTDITNPQQQSQQLRDCCQQLRGVSQQCRCEAIKHAVRQQQQHQQGGQQGQQMQQVYQKARNLPQSCQFQQPQQCDIRVVFV